MLDERIAKALPKVRRYLARRAPGEADDLEQEVLLKLWHARSRVPKDAGEARGFALVVARNVLSSFLRAEYRRRGYESQLAMEPQFARPAPQELLERADKRAGLRDAIRELPANQRAVMERRVEEADVATIAAELGLRPGAVRVRLHRATRALLARVAG